jgi:hypothetical protein
MTKRSYFTKKENNIDILIFDTNPQFQYTVHCHDKNRAWLHMNPPTSEETCLLM